jgi:hypothetical protein
MKKTAIILSAIALIAGSCGQTTNKQTDNTTNVVENITIDSSVIKKLQEEQGGLEYRNDLNYLGLGVVNPKDFHFQFSTDTLKNVIVKIDDIENQPYLIPLLWKPDYLIFYMPVVAITNNYYEVKANATTNVFIPKEEVDFYTWEDLLLTKTTCIVAYIAYREKNIHSEGIKLTDNKDYALIVEKVEDDWLYIRAETEEEIVIDRYWIRWKDKNNLLIKPIFLM